MLLDKLDSIILWSFMLLCNEIACSLISLSIKQIRVLTFCYCSVCVPCTNGLCIPKLCIVLHRHVRYLDMVQDRYRC